MAPKCTKFSSAITACRTNSGMCILSWSGSRTAGWVRHESSRGSRKLSEMMSWRKAEYRTCCSRLATLSLENEEQIAVDRGHDIEKLDMANQFSYLLSPEHKEILTRLNDTTSAGRQIPAELSYCITISGHGTELHQVGVAECAWPS